MTTKPKSDPLVAAETILIEGKAFERGEKVTGVAKEEIDRAVSQRRVIRKSSFDAQGTPAPQLGEDETEDAEGSKTEGTGE